MKRDCRIVVMMCGWLMLVPAGMAQTLEELEQQLKSQRAVESQRRAAEASRAHLVVESDAACELRIDGEAKGRLEPGVPRTVRVAAGEQLIDCVSVEFGEVKTREVREVAAGAKLVLTLDLAGAVAAARKNAEAAAAEQARTRVLELKRAELERRFEPVADGLRDLQQGVVWAARDNGSDINWQQASAYCAGLGEGWSLPTVVQLQSLHDASGTFERKAGGYTIRPATGRLGLTSWVFWSAERQVSAEAWYVYLDDGYRYSNSVSNPSGNRALCVRRS